MTTSPTEEPDDRLQTVMAILIAIVTLVGAVVAWRAAVAGSSLGDADVAGLNATLNAEETLTLTTTELYRHYRAYTAYTRSEALTTALENDPNYNVSEVLGSQRVENADLASANQVFFPRRYLNRDGSYDSTRELGEAWAEAAQTKDLVPEPHFSEADQLRAKVLWLIGALIPLAVALLCFTLTEGMHPARQRLRYLIASVGGVSLATTIIIAITVEAVL